MKPLRRGVFISTEYHDKVWLPFKFESLPNFYFSCGRMGHGVRECDHIPLDDRMKDEDDLPYSNALRAESTMLGKECFKFGVFSKKCMKQHQYTGGATVVENAGDETEMSESYSRKLQV